MRPWLLFRLVAFKVACAPAAIWPPALLSRTCAAVMCRLAPLALCTTPPWLNRFWAAKLVLPLLAMVPPWLAMSPLLWIWVAWVPVWMISPPRLLRLPT